MAEEEKSDGSEKEESFGEEKGSGEIHMKSDRRFRRQLVSCDDASLDEDYELIESIFVDSLGVSAWQSVVPNPKYIQPAPKKKKVESSADVEDEDNLSSSRSSIPARRNYELDFVNCPAWKMGVEPMTYRYMPNNGRYRAFKLARRLDTPKAFKKGFSSSKLSSDQNHLHKEIQRELRKEFELFISLERQRSSLIKQQEAKQKYKDSKKHRDDSSNPVFELHKGDGYKRQSSKETKSVSDNGNEASRHIEKKPHLKQGADSVRPPANLPPLNMQYLTKEEGEYYLEQVSSRLRDLEKTNSVTVKNPKILEGEGFLSSSSYLKQSQSDPGSLCSPREGTIKNSGNQFSKTKRLPTITDSGKEPNFNHVFREIAHRPSIPNRTDSFSNELIISRFESANAGVDMPSYTQEAARRLSGKTAEDDRTKSNYAQSHMYRPPDVGKNHETVYSESPLHSINKGAVRKVHGNSGHIQLFSEYKLRKARENPYNEVDPETVKIIDNIRSSYNVADSFKEDDDVSLESRAFDSSVKDSSGQLRSFTRFVDPRGQNVTPNYEDYAKSQVLRHESGKSQKDRELLNHTVTSKEYAVERKKIGANPYIHKPRPGNAASLTAADSVGLPLQGVSLAPKQAKATSHASVRGNIMPEVMVRRAEIAVTNKRII